MASVRTAPVLGVTVTPQGGGVTTAIDMTSRVISLSFEDNDKAADKLQLKIDNFDLANFDDPIWRKGNHVSVQWGYSGNLSPSRTCLIQKVTGFRELTVEALAQSIEMHKLTKSATFTSTTRSAVVAQVAAANGYSSTEQTIDDTSVVYDAIHQTHETDAAFLQRLAGREGFVFFVDFDGLHWHRRKLGQKPIREFIYYTDPGAGDVLDIEVLNDVTAKPAQVTLKGRDPITKADFSVTGDNANTSRTGLAPDLEVVDPQTGAQTQQANTGTSVTATTTEPNAAAAQRVVDGAYLNSVLTTVQLKVKAVGDPQVVAKTVVAISGIRSLSGNYYLNKVTHKLSPSSYEMEIECKRDGRSKLQPAAASDAKQNAQEPADGGGLQPKEVVNPVTGQTSTVYIDSRGRGQEGD